MIDEIHIRDVALIHEAAFAPSEGLTVITGETGTGKTALLSAVKLLVGERSEAGLVREGSEELQVEGRFFFAKQAAGSSEAAGVDNAGAAAASGADEDAAGSNLLPEAVYSEDGIVVARRVGAQGRSRVTIDGALASVKELAAGIGQTVDLCGQHEHQRLLSPAYQRALLDAWGSAEIAAPLATYQQALRETQDAQAELERLQALESQDSVALDRARFALEQINAVDPQENEYEDLLAQLPRLENGEMLVGESDAAQRSLTEQGGALENLESAMASLDRIAAVDATLENEAQTVRESYYALEDVARTLVTYRDRVDFPREELEAAQDRVAELQGLMRGYGPRMEDVFALRAESQAKLAEYEGRDELIAQARAAREAAEARLLEAAAALREARHAVVPRFLEAVQAQMARLEMGSARLEADLADLSREDWNAWGPHTFELMFAAGEQVRPQRLGRIASGGEMSRVMLALKVVLGECDEVDTLVFDEIDAGVGGQTALALGAVLQDLAKTHQVIVVTHLPQVAVRGAAHYLVTKTNDALPETHLQPLTGQARVEEIARMLAGEVNETSCAHARELLAEQNAAH